MEEDTQYLSTQERISRRLEIEVSYAKPIFSNVEFLSVCLVVNWSRDIKISDVCKDKDAVVMEVGICEGKQNLKVCGRLFVPWGTSEDEAEMSDTCRFSGTSTKNRSMPMWTLGLVSRWVWPAPTWKKMHRK